MEIPSRSRKYLSSIRSNRILWNLTDRESCSIIRTLKEVPMNMTRFDPYRELSNLQDQFSRALGSAFGRSRREDETLAAWVPPVDITEEKERIVITAELPGF